MAHVGQERRLGPARLLRRRQRIAERLLLHHVLAGLRIGVGETGSHAVDVIAFLFAREVDPGKADGLVGFVIVAEHGIGVGDNLLMF